MEAWSLGPNMLSAAVRGGEAAADFSANVILDQYARFSVPYKPARLQCVFLKVRRDDGFREVGTHQFSFRPLAITFDAFVNMTGNLDGNRYRFFNHLLLVVVIDSFVADVAGKNLNGSVEDDQFIFMQIDINFVTHGRGLSG